MSAFSLSPGPFTLAAHHGYPDGLRNGNRQLPDTGRERSDADLRPRARRARNNLHASVPQAERTQYLPRRANLVLRRRGKRHADRVPDPFIQQNADPTADLIAPGEYIAGFRDTDVQRRIRKPGDIAVGRHSRRHVRRLERNFVVFQACFFRGFHIQARAGDELLAV